MDLNYWIQFFRQTLFGAIVLLEVLIFPEHFQFYHFHLFEASDRYLLIARIGKESKLAFLILKDGIFHGNSENCLMDWQYSKVFI